MIACRHPCTAMVLLIGLALALGGCAHYTAKSINLNATATAFDRRSLDDPGLHAALQHSGVAEASNWPVRAWSFEGLCWVAFHYHPSLELARAQLASAEAGRITAASRPNPTVSLTPGYNSGAGATSPWFPAVSFDVPIETAGKRSRRSDQAQHAAESARQKVLVAAWQVRSDLRRALAAWIHAFQRSEALSRQVLLDQRVMELTASRRIAGAASAPETSATRLAWSRSQADAAAALRQVTVARHNVAQALGVPAAATETLIHTEALVVERFKTDLELTAARALALRSHPELLAALADYAVSQSVLRLEIARQYPDISL